MGHLHGPVTSNVLVLALSYCWTRRDHPDPDGRTLADVCEFLEYLEASRHFETGNKHKIGDKELVIFWDFPALYQNLSPWPEDDTVRREEDSRTEAQLESFKQGLRSVNLWYAHVETWVILATHAYRTTPYLSSGWPFFEFLTSQLIKDADLAIDLPTALAWIRRTGMDPLESKRNRSIYWLFFRGLPPGCTAAAPAPAQV